MSVKRAQREIDSPEFSEWMAYAEIEPFGPIREDLRAGQVAALIANVNRDPKTKPDAYTAEDFFPPPWVDVQAAEVAAPEPVDLGSKLTAWALAMSDDNRKKQKGPKARPEE